MFDELEARVMRDPYCKNCRKTIICNVPFSGAHVKTMES